MNCFVIAATIACVLSVALASSNHKVEKVHSEILSYVNDNMGGVTMMRGNSAHLECYNGFVPLMNSLAARARDYSYGCVNTANVRKDMELAALNDARSTVSTEIDKITKSLTDCSELDGLDFFQCLDDNAEANRQLMDIIQNKSRQLMSHYAAHIAEIDGDEATCLMDGIDNAKNESDQAFDDLKKCIKSGPVIQAQIDQDPST